MAKEKVSKAQNERQREGALEKGSRWYRNFNAAVGGVALLGAGVVSSPLAAGALKAYAGFNFIQAGIGEAGRRYAKKKRKKKEDSKKS